MKCFFARFRKTRGLEFRRSMLEHFRCRTAFAARSMDVIVYCVATSCLAGWGIAEGPPAASRIDSMRPHGAALTLAAAMQHGVRAAFSAGRSQAHSGGGPSTAANGTPHRLVMAIVRRGASVPLRPKMVASLPGIENVLRLTDRVYSGGEPRGDQAFAALRAMGITTVISVDGAEPDVETARRHGLRYIHLPFGYDGIPPKVVRQLERVAREVSGPVFVHCHHGKHRGPAAAAILCQLEGDADVLESLAFLAQAGTSRDYSGLWRSVEHLPDASQIPSDIILPDRVPGTPFCHSMVVMSRSLDALQEIVNRKEVPGNGPTTEADSPPNDPREPLVAQATLLYEGLREASRFCEGANAEAMRRRLDAGQSLAKELVESVRAADFATSRRLLGRLEQSCTDCHRAFRR